MASEPEKPRDDTPAPSRKERLVWWFGIYLAGAAVFPIWLLIWQPRHFSASDLLAPIFALVFPAALVGVFDFLPSTFFSDDQAGGRAAAAMLIGPVMAYVLYITHLVKTLKVKTRRAFRLLLLGLVIIVSANLAGCYRLLTEGDKPAVFHQAQLQR